MTCQFAGHCTAEATVVVRIASVGDRSVCAEHYEWMVANGMDVRLLDPNEPRPRWRERDLSRDMSRVA